MAAPLDDSTIQLRCESGLHGIIKWRKNIRVYEIRCKNKWCTDRVPGIVVLHYFNVETGELVDTNKFRDPNVEKTGFTYGQNEAPIFETGSHPNRKISQFRRKGKR